MNKLCTVVLLAGAGSAALAADVAWVVRPNSPSDSDINTEGRCVYAYTPSGTETKVNGLQFGRVTYLPNHEWDPVSNFADDAVFDTGFTRNCAAGWMGETQRAAWDAAGGSAEYKNLLNVSWYRSIGSVPNSTLTLRGLTVGKRYLVQIWICDARNATSGNLKTLTVGGVTGTCYGENGYGSHFIGRFTADADTQDLVFTYAHEAQFNAFQLRCLDEANVDWTSAWTSGESDIRTEGYPLYAYKPNNSQTIAGTPFIGKLDVPHAYYGDANDPDIRYDNPTNGMVRKSISHRHDDFCIEDATVPTGAYSYSAAYRDFIDSAFTEVHAGAFSRRTMVLRHLTPGKRYLVQLWVIDNRYWQRAQASTVVGFGAMVQNNAWETYGHGSYAVGIFTAVSSEQPISLYHRSCTEPMEEGELNARDNYGPIQVRCLDGEQGEEENVWYVGNTGVDGSVDTRGQLLWAFSGVQTTVAGTLFSQFYDTSGNYDELVVKGGGVVEPQTRHTGRAFISQAKVEVTPAVSNLIGNAIFCDSSRVDHELELHKLTPGKRYLVQAWFMDTRKVREGSFAGRTVQFRIVSGDTAGNIYYDADRAPLGQYVTGIFRATNECHAIASNWGPFQINAIQVRTLDDLPVDSEIRWTGAETQTGDTSVSTEGTLRYAYAPYEFTTDSGVFFAAGASQSTDLGGGNVLLSHPFTYTSHGWAVPGETLKLFTCCWYETLGSTETNRTVTLGNLKPTYEYLVQLFVTDVRADFVGARMMKIKDQAVRYGPAWDTYYPRGGVLTGRFAANATTKSFTVRYDSYLTAQLNAIQVREIGPTQPERNLASSADWTTDGAGWTVNGEDQAGTTLWNAAVGATETAYVGGDATLNLGADVTVGGLCGAGTVTIGSVGTDKAISVKNEIIAPTATVNAVWAEAVVHKYAAGTTVLAGACPALNQVRVLDGRLVLDGAVSRPLEITVASPGTLGFTTNRVLSIGSLAGDGTLAGPGGIVLDDGAALAVPAGLTYAEDFTWTLASGSTLTLPTGCDASRLRISVSDPAAYCDTLIVTHDGTATGKPTFVLDRNYRAFREGNGWRIGRKPGLAIIFR